MERERVVIKESYITLSRLLKAVDIIATGGEAKWFLMENDVFLNGERETRRGKKLYPGDIIEVDGKGYEVTDEDR